LHLTYQGDVIRPPAEAASIILQAVVGCPFAGCRFCGAYRNVVYSPRAVGEFERHCEWVAGMSAREDARVFLADGDLMFLSASQISAYMEVAKETFPFARRFSCYAGGKGLIGKSADELARFKREGLNTVYLGLESGDESILRSVNKSATAQEMTTGIVRAQNSGIRASVIVLLGLGGKAHSKSHASNTAAVLNAMQPRMINFLTLMLVPGTELHASALAGDFLPLDWREMLDELRDMISNLKLTRSVVRANHASSFLPLEGSFPKDKENFLERIDRALAGKSQPIPDFMRGL